MKEKKFICFIEVALLIGIVFSFSYFMGLVSGAPLDSFPGGISAFLDSDASKTSVCPESLDGKICQEYPRLGCDENCVVPCFESREETECQLGTCVDSEEGVCQFNVPKRECKEENGGVWNEDVQGNIPECEKHCCVLGEQTKFVTEKQCSKMAESMGIEMIFDTNFIYEMDCLLFAQRAEEGACVLGANFENPEKNDCRFVTRDECESLGGEFNSGFLCSGLDTVCEKEVKTGCVEGFDEVYWFDSCGNRENIFGSGESGGMVLSKAESCEIGSDGDWLRNQKSCGNCNRLFGSVCGNESAGQELNDNPDGNVVCRDLGCYEEDGTRRENGETWCVYQSATGVAVDIPFAGGLSYFFGGFKIPGGISMDPPGSRHFRKSCLNGEIDIEECYDGRSAICVESRVEKEGGGEIATAACRANRWQECLNYNSADSGSLDAVLGLGQIPMVGQALGMAMKPLVENEKLKVAQMMLKCEKDPDCFVSSVSVGKDFKFPMCIGKYAPGFEIKEESGADTICGYASQICASVWVKEATAFTFSTTAHWECKANCDCVEGSSPDSAVPSKEFVQQMHDLCISLGDCGMDFNYQGGLGGVGTGYTLKRNVYDGLPEENKEKKGEIVFAMPPVVAPRNKPIPGKFISADSEALWESLGESSGGGGEGVGGVAGAPDFEPYNPNTGMLIASLSTGGTAIGVSAVAKAGLFGGSAAASSLSTSGAGGVAPIKTDALWTGPFAYDPGTNLRDIPAMYQSPTGALSPTPVEGGQLVPVGTSGGEYVAADASIYAPTSQGANAPATPAMGPTLAGFGNLLTGVSIGIAVTSILLGVSGVGRGVGTGGTIAYMVAGGVAGAGIAVLVSTAAAEFVGAQIASVLRPAGPIIAVIVIADIITNWIAGVGDKKTSEMIFECKPWQPPVGGADCGKCGEDGFTCSKYACESLGQSCTFIAEEPNALCIDESPNDVTGPKILGADESVLSENYEYSDITEDGFKIRSTELNKCLTQFDFVKFGIELDEYGRCRLGKPGAEFESMIDFGGSNSLKKNHTHVFRYSDLSSLGIEEPELERDTEVNLAVVCEDSKGHKGREYFVNVCIFRIDISAPIIEIFGEENFFVPYGVSEREVVLRTREEVEMRWSFEDKDFDEMENNFVCAEEDGWFVCRANVQIRDENTEVFVRAKDNPEWVGTERENERNENQQSTGIKITRTENPLVIESVKPDGDVIKTGSAATSVEVEVRTSGGDEASTYCYLGPGQVDLLPRIESGLFRKSYESFSEGEHSLVIECFDDFGNSASKTTGFKIEKDLMYPIVTRVYEDSGSLVVVTDEQASCAFVNSAEEAGCGFNFEEGEVLGAVGGTEGIVHSVVFDREKTYYVKCKDKYENKPGGCNIVVSGGGF